MDHNPEPQIYTILVNWNNWRDTVECLESLKGITYTNNEVIVVDNASSDDSVIQIREQYPKAILLENDTNLGFAGGNNVGIRYAMDRGCELLWILNNDTVVDPEALSALVSRVRSGNSIGICGSKLIYYHNRDLLQALGGGRYNKWLGVTRNIGHKKPVTYSFDQGRVEKRLDYIVTASMLVSREFVEEVGYMNEDYFLYYEEIDWAVRAENKFRLAFAPGSKVYHKEGASIKGGQLEPSQKSRLSDFFQIRNRIRFTAKHFPYCLPTVYLTVLAAIFKRILRGQWDRVPMILKIMFGFESEFRIQESEFRSQSSGESPLEGG